LKKAPRTAHGKDISNFGLNVKKFHSREYNTAKFRDINKKILLLIMITLFTSILMVRWNIISLFVCKLRNKVIIV